MVLTGDGKSAESLGKGRDYVVVTAVAGREKCRKTWNHSCP